MRLNTKTGFTLVEIMVAVSIFSVVALIATSALINANRLSQKAQATKLVLDNLNFALDSMLFKIRRTGQVFYCSNAPSFPAVPGTSNSCDTGGTVLVLGNLENSTQVMYFYDALSHSLKYQESGGGAAVRLTTSAITIDTTTSKFKVYNAAGESGWPRVEVALAGSAQVGHETTNFALQTTATARQ